MDGRHLGAQVSDDAYAGWHGFARIHGTSVAALLEAVGLWLGEQDGPGPPWPMIVATARDLTAQRRLRREP
jgi:hypothetical protein